MPSIREQAHHKLQEADEKNGWGIQQLRSLFGPAISFAIHPAPGTKSRTAVPMMQDLKAAEKSSPSEEATSSGNLFALSISSPQAKRDRLIQKNSSPGMWINIGSVTPDADKVVIRETVSGGALACRVPRPPEGLAIGGTIEQSWPEKQDSSQC